MKMEKIGEWSFLAGVVLAILLALLGEFPYGGLLLVVLGIIVGFLNITEKETPQFLIASLALLLPGTIAKFGEIPLVGNLVVDVLGNIAIFVGPAAIVVALKTIWTLAKK